MKALEVSPSLYTIKYNCDGIYLRYIEVYKASRPVYIYIALSLSFFFYLSISKFGIKLIALCSTGSTHMFFAILSLFQSNKKIKS